MNRLLPDRAVVDHLRALTRKRLVDRRVAVAVKTWCRKCGLPVLLNVYRDYEYAKRHFYALDDQPMVHKNVHAEVGGWGVHWRLDEVLSVLFSEHEEVCWPKPDWYEYSESEDYNILVLDEDNLRGHMTSEVVDVELKMMLEAINRVPRSRDQLKEHMGEVWDSDELRERFEVLGYRAPFAVVRDRKTGERGSVLFQNNPRYYFGFSPERHI